MTKIGWTEETWNPTVGCSRVSPGCDNCYAIGVAHRAMQPAHVGLTVKHAGLKPDWTGEVRCLPDRLDTPHRWRKPRYIFIDSMSDLFHAEVPDGFVGSVWSTMADTPRHTYQVLTKRPQRMSALITSMGEDATGSAFGGPIWRDHQKRWNEVRPGQWPLPNVWVGASIESDSYAFRAGYVRATPAAKRILSLEPLLGPLPSLVLSGIDWVIVGAESFGPRAGRPMALDWVRDIRDRCQAAGIPLFVKQIQIDGRKVTDIDLFPADLRYQDMPQREVTA